MTSRSRLYLLEVASDSDKTVRPLFEEFKKYHRCDDMLEWVIDQRLAGRTFARWVREQFFDEVELACRYICFRVRNGGRPKSRSDKNFIPRI